MVQRHRVDGRVDTAAGEDGRQGRGEAEPPAHVGQVQRLDPQAVAAEQQAPAVTLGDGEGEHAHQPFDEAVAPLPVGLEQHLGVAVGEEPVALVGQLAAQLRVVVDAAVEGHGQAELGVVHRLLAGGREVDDGQPAVAQRHLPLRPTAPGVGATGHHRVGHGRHRSHVGLVSGRELSGKATHGRGDYPFAAGPSPDRGDGRCDKVHVCRRPVGPNW
nr:hypothetical protein [Aquihabitans sp. G128]